MNNIEKIKNMNIEESTDYIRGKFIFSGVGGMTNSVNQWLESEAEDDRKTF